MRFRSSTNGNTRGTTAIALTLILGSVVVQVSSETVAPVQFSFVCAKPSIVLSPDFQQIVSSLITTHGDEGVKKWGDRAVRFQLGGPGSLAYFVPLSCGATGSCLWALLVPSPARSLGILQGSVVQVRPGAAQWPPIDSFSGYGSGEGDLATYTFHHGAYHRTAVGRLKPEAVDRFQSCVDNETCCPRPAT